MPSTERSEAPTLLSEEEESDLQVNGAVIQAVVAAPGRLPFHPAAVREARTAEVDEDERAAYRSRLLQANAREDAQGYHDR